MPRHQTSYLTDFNGLDVLGSLEGKDSGSFHRAGKRDPILLHFRLNGSSKLSSHLLHAKESWVSHAYPCVPSKYARASLNNKGIYLLDNDRRWRDWTHSSHSHDSGTVVGVL